MLFYYAFQALDELQHFMLVKELPSKTRQKLMRNLRVRKHRKDIVMHENQYYVLYVSMLAGTQFNAGE